jgi:NAD(P)H dehydrogenase (quinone)
VGQQVHIAVVYHTVMGHTGRCADAVSAGASAVPDSEVNLVKLDDMGREEWRTLDGAEAIIFGTPTFMGSASASFHAFAESSSRRWMTGAWRDKLAAGFTNSSAKAGDKSSTLGYLGTFAAQHGMIWVNLGLPPGWNSTKGSDQDLNRLGFWAGAAAQCNIDEPADAVPDADLRTAEHLGRRVAELARIVVAGRRAASLVANE